MDFKTCQRKFTSELDIFKNNYEIEAKMNGINVDDGLSAQDNETFLIASMAFLQQHAKRKLGASKESTSDISDDQAERKKFKRTYSNMLLFETPSISENGQKERFYLKLKNSEKFLDVIKNETCLVPSNILSQEQLLPAKVKNPKRFPKLFNSRSNISTKRKIETLTPRNSIFNLFRSGRNKKFKNSSTTQVPIIIDNKHDTKRVFEKDWMSEISQKSQKSFKHKPELELISELSMSEHNSLNKQNSNKKFSAKLSDSLTTVEKYILEDNEKDKVPNQSNNNKIKIMSHEYYCVDKRREKYKRLSRPLSKISVCIEEEDEEDTDEDYQFNNQKRKYPSTKEKRDINMEEKRSNIERTASQISGFSNFSDELKANLTSEVLNSIISQMIVYLEDAPEHKDVVNL